MKKRFIIPFLAFFLIAPFAHAALPSQLGAWTYDPISQNFSFSDCSADATTIFNGTNSTNVGGRAQGVLVTNPSAIDDMVNFAYTSPYFALGNFEIQYNAQSDFTSSCTVNAHSYGWDSLPDGTYSFVVDTHVGSAGQPYNQSPIIGNSNFAWAPLYYEFNISGGTITTPTFSGFNTYTHVIGIAAPQAYATSSSPVNFQFTAVVNTDVGSSTDGYALTVRDETTGLSTVFAYGALPAYTMGTSFVVSTSTPVATSTALTATIQLVTGYQAFLRTGQNPVFIPASSFTVPFAVGNIYSSRSNPSPSAYAGNAFSSTTCNVNFLGNFDLSGCAGYLLSPSATTMANFSDLSQGLQTRAPFVYAYQIGALRQQMFSASSTGTTTIAVTVPNFGTITFLSEAMIAAVPFSPLIKTVLGYIMWFLLIDLVYLTVIRSHNQNTGV